MEEAARETSAAVWSWSARRSKSASSRSRSILAASRSCQSSIPFSELLSCARNVSETVPSRKPNSTGETQLVFPVVEGLNDHTILPLVGQPVSWHELAGGETPPAGL